MNSRINNIGWNNYMTEIGFYITHSFHKIDDEPIFIPVKSFNGINSKNIIYDLIKNIKEIKRISGCTYNKYPYYASVKKVKKIGSYLYQYKFSNTIFYGFELNMEQAD